MMIVAAVLFATAAAAAAPAATSTDGMPANCPMHAEHMKQAAAASEVEHNHDTFGMAHDATTHNFRLFDDGGAIELRANDPKDTKSIDAIRAHLRSVAADFTANDFAKPLFVHGKLPDGVPAMKDKSTAISYRYEEVPSGGRVRITTRDAEALAAVHSFLRFQVGEHKTADTGQVER